MRYTAMEWYRRANMACLAGGADIVPDEQPKVELCLCGEPMTEDHYCEYWIEGEGYDANND